MQETLWSPSEALRAFLDATPDIVLVADPAGMVVAGNAAASVAFGRSADELAGASIDALVAEHPSPLEARVGVLGEGLHVHVLRDATERRVAERRVAQLGAVARLGVYALEQHELAPILDRAVAVLAATLGCDHAAIHAGGGEPRLTPVDASAAIALPIGGADRRWGVIAASWRRPRPASAHETALVQAIGNVVATAVARAESEADRHAAERRAEDARVRAAQAQEALRLRDEFLSIASHELKTPLTSLQLQLESLMDWEDELDSRIVPKLARATRSAERLAALVETLLDVSRLATGRMRLDVAEVGLDEVVVDVCERLRTEAERAGCAVDVDVDGAPSGRWDRLRLEQVLVNLLANAFKYGAGRPVTVRARETGAGAELTVRDHGPGVRPEDASRIFDRFERAVSSQHYGGLGLGLYVARQIVEAHGGEIAVDSRPGAGATFRVRIPLDATARALPRRPPPPAQELHG